MYVTNNLEELIWLINIVWAVLMLMMNNSYLLSKHLNHQLISLHLQVISLYLSLELQFAVRGDEQSTKS